MESSLIILQQMLVLVCMMVIGFFAYHMKWVGEIAEQQISKLVVNVFNPVLVISGVLGRNHTGGKELIVENLRAVFLYYVIVIILGYVGSALLRPKKKERSQYQLMFVFSNVGFMGIPVMTGLFGKECVIYITFYLLGYNFLLYTYGVAVAKKGSKMNTEKKDDRKCAPKNTGKDAMGALKGILNPGVFACIVAIIIFALQIPVPDAAVTFFDYVGNATIPLSMMMIGISVAKMSWKKIVSNLKMYLFCGIKLLAVPILAAVLCRNLFTSDMLRGIFVLLLSMPVGSIVAMMANEYGEGETLCSQGIILSTLMSMISIPIVTFFI